MKTFDLHCEDPWFTYLKKGIKPVEGRKNSPTYKEIKVGDVINFNNGNESFNAEVVEIRQYDSLEHYFADVTLEKALPGIRSIEEGLKVYHQWSSPESIKKWGFLGIFIKPLVLASYS